MDWIQVLTIIGTVLGAAAYLHSDFRVLENRLDTHIVAINERVDAANARTDALISILIDVVKKQK
jgi:hypothetical protein